MFFFMCFGVGFGPVSLFSPIELSPLLQPGRFGVLCAAPFGGTSLNIFSKFFPVFPLAFSGPRFGSGPFSVHFIFYFFFFLLFD